MEYMVIGICIIIIVAIGARVLFKRKSKAAMISTISALSKVNEEPSPSSQEGETAQDLAIQVEMLPVEAINGESRLTEITNSEVLGRVSRNHSCRGKACKFQRNGRGGSSYIS